MNIEDEYTQEIRRNAQQPRADQPTVERIEEKIDMLVASDAAVTVKPRRQLIRIAGIAAGIAAATAIVVSAQSTISPAQATWAQGLPLDTQVAVTHKEGCVNAFYSQSVTSPDRPGYEPADLSNLQVTFAEDRGDLIGLAFRSSQGGEFLCVKLAAQDSYWAAAKPEGQDYVHFWSQYHAQEAPDGREYQKQAEVTFRWTSPEFERYETTLSSGLTLSGAVQGGVYLESILFETSTQPIAGGNGTWEDFRFEQFSGAASNSFDLSDVESSEFGYGESNFWPETSKFFRTDGSGRTVTFGDHGTPVQQIEFAN